MGSEMERQADRYYRPSVSTDIIVFHIREGREESWRHDPEKRLSVLLIRRGLEPFKGFWALPGGFLREGETLEQCAAREVKEETGVLPRVLMPCGVYDAPDRDPRERVITRAYASILNGTELAARGGDDASEAAWFDLDCIQQDGMLHITLTGEKETLCCRVGLKKKRFGEPDCEIIENGGLAFDHAGILAAALITLREKVSGFDSVFEFLPPLFTLSSLQNVIEAVCGITFTPANFRRKIAPYVEETEEYIRGSGHRPARLYRKTEPSIEGGNKK